MSNLPAVTNAALTSKTTKDLVEAQTAKILELLPNVIDQYAHDIRIAGRIQQHISGDNLVNPSPILNDPRSMNDFLKRVDIIKFTLLKAAGLVAPVANNVHVQQVFNQNNTNVLDPGLFAALGGFLELDGQEDQTGQEVSGLDNAVEEAEVINE